MIIADLKEPVMGPTSGSRARRTIGRMKRLWQELDYVQRRVLEHALRDFRLAGVGL